MFLLVLNRKLQSWCRKEENEVLNATCTVKIGNFILLPFKYIKKISQFNICLWDTR